MACADVYATPEQYSEWWGWWQFQIDLTTLSPEEITALENQLQQAAGRINVTLQSAGMCDCNLPAPSLEFLKELNCIATAVVYRAPCGPRLSDDDRKLWLEQLNSDLTMIQKGEVELCAGYTSKSYIAFATAQPNYGPLTEQDLIKNDIIRNQG